MKYTNLVDTPLFGEYTDPYQNRRIKGPLFLKETYIASKTDYHLNYNHDKLYFSWFGHSSVFLNIHGKSILIDPIFSDYDAPIHLKQFKRFTKCDLDICDLPLIDLVLITHCHYDHLDKKTIKLLASKTKRFIVPAGVDRYLKMFGIDKNKIYSLNWFEKYNEQDLFVEALPSRHSSARYLFDSKRSLWCSYIIGDNKHIVYDSGDGGYSDYFKEIKKKYPLIDLSIIECGQYNQKWHGLHMFPEESVKACLDLETKLAIPVHFGAFVLSDHAWDEPPCRFEIAAKENNLNYILPELNKLICI